jgi:hypothetical protein
MTLIICCLPIYALLFRWILAYEERTFRMKESNDLLKEFIPPEIKTRPISKKIQDAMNEL